MVAVEPEALSTPQPPPGEGGRPILELVECTRASEDQLMRVGWELKESGGKSASFGEESYGPEVSEARRCQHAARAQFAWYRYFEMVNEL